MAEGAPTPTTRTPVEEYLGLRAGTLSPTEVFVVKPSTPIQLGDAAVRKTVYPEAVLGEDITDLPN